jgi:hypothetical protein
MSSIMPQNVSAIQLNFAAACKSELAALQDRLANVGTRNPRGREVYYQESMLRVVAAYHDLVCVDIADGVTPPPSTIKLQLAGISGQHGKPSDEDANDVVIEYAALRTNTIELDSSLSMVIQMLWAGLPTKKYVKQVLNFNRVMIRAVDTYRLHYYEDVTLPNNLSDFLVSLFDTDLGSSEWMQYLRQLLNS